MRAGLTGWVWTVDRLAERLSMTPIWNISGWSAYTSKMRKPGEPIYLRGHMLALVLAVVAPVFVPHLYEALVGPLGFVGRMILGILIAIAAGTALYFIYRSSARNEP